jgi:colicin import membrane protein
MPDFAREHLRPLVGSAALHLVLLALLAGAALNWTSKQPPVQLAIEGTVVQYKDLPRSVRSGKALVEPAPAPVIPAAKPEPAPPPEPRPNQQAEAAAAAARAKEAAALEQRRADEARTVEVQQEKAREAAAAEKRKAAARNKAAEDARRKAQEAEARQQAETGAKQERAAKEKAAQDAKLKAAREADIKRALAAEEEGAAIAQSGVMDEYRALLVQTIERNWIRPPSARAGLECTLNVTQATGGTVIDVKLGDCNGDQAVRESITNAVYRSSPLPAPRDPRAFERRLVIVFKPTE